MDAQTLKAEVRKERGKGPARQLRMKGLIPAVFYGPGKEPQNLTVSPEALVKLITGPWGRNQLIELHFEGRRELVLVRDVEVHPVSRNVLHADFYSVALDRPVRVMVPFSTRGRALGVQKGGVLRVIYRQLPVLSKPDAIPPSIEVDVSSLDSGGSVRVKDIPLPQGVRIDLPPERPVASIVAKEKDKPEESAAAAQAPAATTPAAPASAKDAKPAAKDDKKKK